MDVFLTINQFPILLLLFLDSLLNFLYFVTYLLMFRIQHRILTPKTLLLLPGLPGRQISVLPFPFPIPLPLPFLLRPQVLLALPSNTPHTILHPSPNFHQFDV